MVDFKHKAGVILGIANEKSIAYSIAEKLVEAGAKLAVTYPNEAIQKRVEPIAENLKIRHIFECDVANEEHLKALRDNLRNCFGKIDFLVHSVAFAERQDLQGRFIETSKEGFMKAIDVSAYSLLGLARDLEDLFNDNASILTLTYLGSTRVVPNYNVMGVAKAALEAIVRYLAYDLGHRGIRVNAVSAGPIKTLAASGISGLGEMLKSFEEKSLLKRRVSQEDVAHSGCFLLSDEASAITGEILFVDCGYNNLAF